MVMIALRQFAYFFLQHISYIKILKLLSNLNFIRNMQKLKYFNRLLEMQQVNNQRD